VNVRLFIVFIDPQLFLHCATRTKRRFSKENSPSDQTPTCRCVSVGGFCCWVRPGAGERHSLPTFGRTMAAPMKSAAVPPTLLELEPAYARPAERESNIARLTGAAPRWDRARSYVPSNMTKVHDGQHANNSSSVTGHSVYTSNGSWPSIVSGRIRSASA
jgi:hypothetical protein